MLLHDIDGYANGPQRNAIRTLLVLSFPTVKAHSPS